MKLNVKQRGVGRTARDYLKNVPVHLSAGACEDEYIRG
jgi:hypothetical protein